MKFKNFNLKNKRALITGAAGLMGYEHAVALLQSGSEVILTDINIAKLKLLKQKLLKDYNKKNIMFYSMDVTNEKSVINVLKKIKNTSKVVNILINNAAIDHKMKNLDNNLNYSRVENFSIQQWDNEINVGLKGPFICSKIFGEHMSKNINGGVILNIASDLSVISPDQRLYKSNKNINSYQQPVKPVTYSIIKSGLIGLTRYFATYWIDSKVRCNALSPGGIYTNQSEEFVDKISKLIPMGRMANHDEYRGAIQFLCSDASKYMNGHNLIIDGGRTVW